MDTVWYRNDRRILFTSQWRIRAKYIDRFYKLLLDDTEYDDQGLYEMHCENIKTSCHLTVQEIRNNISWSFKKFKCIRRWYSSFSMSFISIKSEYLMVERWY